MLLTIPHHALHPPQNKWIWAQYSIDQTNTTLQSYSDQPEILTRDFRICNQNLTMNNMHYSANAFPCAQGHRMLCACFMSGNSLTIIVCV